MKSLKVEGVSKPNGYSQLVVSSAHTTLYISGQTPTDRFGNTVGVGDFEKQIIQTFENLGRCLKTANATFDDLVKLTIYVVPMDKFELVRKVRKKYLNQRKLPSISSVGVTSLVGKDWLIEIEAIAELKGS